MSQFLNIVGDAFAENKNERDTLESLKESQIFLLNDYLQSTKDLTTMQEQIVQLDDEIESTNHKIDESRKLLLSMLTELQNQKSQSSEIMKSILGTLSNAILNMASSATYSVFVTELIQFENQIYSLIESLKSKGTFFETQEEATMRQYIKVNHDKKVYQFIKTLQEALSANADKK